MELALQDNQGYVHSLPHLTTIEVLDVLLFSGRFRRPLPLLVIDYDCFNEPGRQQAVSPDFWRLTG